MYVDYNTVFFYAGNRDEDLHPPLQRTRSLHASTATTPERLKLYTDNPKIKLNVKKEASFRVVEKHGCESLTSSTVM